MTPDRDGASLEPARYAPAAPLRGWRWLAAWLGRRLEPATDQRLQMALHGGHKGLWDYDFVTGMRYHSPGFHARLGLTPGEFTGTAEWFDAHTHPDDRQRWLEALARHRAHREAFDLELRLLAASGDYRWFRLRAQSAVDAAGRLVRVTGLLHDISEHRYAEQRLRESEASFRSLSAASPVGILKADAQGECLYTNSRWQELAGLSELEAMGAGWLDAIDPRDRDLVERCWREFTVGGIEFDLEFRLTTPTGELRWVRSRANAVLDELCAVAGFVATIEDVTEARVAALALAEARDKAMLGARVKSEFLANMSHEIRTPINGVIGMTELLMGTKLDDEQRDYVHTINTSADALLGIINDVLDFSKIEAGKMAIEWVELDIRELAEDVAELVAARARERGLELVLAVDARVPRCMLGDPMRIRQVLLNLASNAIKFTERGEVVIGADLLVEPGHPVRLKLWVRDSGIGIPADRLGAVFESFTQADGSTTRRYGGTGLGLTICRQLAALMGGSVHAASEVGVGSEFWLELPLEEAPATRGYEIVCDLSGLHVLVVDDHPLNRRILLETLRGWGARPEEVASGEAALATVSRQAGDPYSVVLLDHRMPGIDGCETALRLSALPGAAQRVVLMLSSLGIVGDAAERARLGIAASLTKPVREAALHQALCQALGRVPDLVAGELDPAEATLDHSGLAVLLVEDNEVNRKVAARMLEKLGCMPDFARNGIEAIERVAARDYDLVLMDCQMPELDGFEATRAIRRSERGGRTHVHIVAMTANAMEGDRERCLDAGMDDYVTKPVTLERITQQLHATLERQRKAA